MIARTFGPWHLRIVANGLGTRKIVPQTRYCNTLNCCFAILMEKPFSHLAFFSMFSGCFISFLFLVPLQIICECYEHVVREVNFLFILGVEIGSRFWIILSPLNSGMWKILAFALPKNISTFASNLGSSFFSRNSILIDTILKISLCEFVGFYLDLKISFCPSLSVIAGVLHLSENIAGVTILAFGNGAPDIFTSLVSDEREMIIMFTELIGAGIFVTAIIAGSVILVSPCRISFNPFTRDCCFYIIAVSWISYVSEDEIIHLWEALSKFPWQFHKINSKYSDGLLFKNDYFTFLTIYNSLLSFLLREESSSAV